VSGSTLPYPPNGTAGDGDPGPAPIGRTVPHGLPEDPLLIVIALAVVGTSVLIARAISPPPRRGRPT
jgi:hypothetical protein